MKMFKRMFSAFVAVFAAISAFAATPVTTEAELKSALASGGEVTLGANIEVAEMIEIASGTTATLDLNGYAITSGYQTDSTTKHIYPFNNYGTFTIKDGKDTGSITGRGIYVQSGSKLTVESGSIYGIDSNGGSALFQYGGDIVINGGHIEQKAEGTYNFAINASDGTVIVSDGWVGGNHGAIAAVGAAVTIKGGTFVCTGTAGMTDNVLYSSGSGSITIDGGTFIADGDSASGGCCVYDTNGKATINGGNFSNSSGGDVWGTTGTVINGGTFENLTETARVAVGATIVNAGTAYTKTESGLDETVAKIGSTAYATFAAALTAANAMTGDVTVEIFSKVEYADATPNLTGAYDSINFVGKAADAEISITRNGSNGYISGDDNDCAVTFTDLILSKPEGYYANDAGFMNQAFTVYRVGSVAYTDCTFPNGACAAGCPTTYTGCTFQKSHEKYALWAYGSSEIKVDTCVFDDDRGVKMYAEGSAKTTAIEIVNSDFSKLTSKPAIVATLGSSITLSGNTYSAKGVLELEDNGSSNGITINSMDTVTCISDAYPDGCGVLVGDKIYRTVADAAAVAMAGSTVTLLHNSSETVELVEGVTLDKNGFTADSVTVKGPAADLVISTVDQLKAFAAAVNGGESYEGKTVELANDIDLNYTAVVIGTRANPFKGTFDGKDHVISNLSIYENGSDSDYFADSDDCVGLFGVINTPAVVKNVTVDNPYIVGSSYVGGIVGMAYTGSIQNCHVTGEIDIEGFYMVGGITGHGYARIYDCSVVGAEDGDCNYVGATYKQADLEGDNVGGIVGHNAEGNVISGCTVKNITVSGTRKVGGIVGITAQNGDVVDCTVDNVTVETTATEEYAAANAKTMSIGGLIGQYQSSGDNDGAVTGCSIANVMFANENDVTVSIGVVSGGLRGTSDSTVPPADTIAVEGNTIDASTITGANNTYLTDFVAQIGDEYYTSLQSAIDAVKDDETVLLLQDVTVTTPAYGQNALNHARAVGFTLDLNGKTLSADTGNSVFRFNIANSGATDDVAITIKNGKVISGANTWCTLMASGISADVRAVMNLEDLTVEANKGGDLAVKAWANGVVNAKNVTVNASYAGGFYARGGEIVLDDCTVNQSGLWTAPYLSVTVGVSNGGKLTVNSGTYTAVPKTAADGYNQGTTHGSWCGGVMSSGGTLIINDGTFANGNVGGTASNPRELFTVGADADYGDNVAAVLQINGGTFSSIGALTHCETIWGSETDAANTYMPTMGVAITKGDFTAVAGKVIGGCDPISTSNPVDVTISGGTYAATHAIDASYLADGFGLVLNEDGTYTVIELPTGDIQVAYISDNFNHKGYSAILGEAVKVKAKESFVVKMYAGETLVGTAALNDPDKILLNGVSRTVSWHAPLTDDGDAWWITEWVDGALKVDSIPDKVELWVDGMLVSTGKAVLNNADNSYPVVAARVGNGGEVENFITAATWVNNADYAAALNGAFATDGKITLLRDVKVGDIQVPADKTIVFDLNGKTLSADDVAQFVNCGDLTIRDSSKEQNATNGLDVANAGTLAITSGHYAGSISGEGEFAITGGTYAQDVTDYCADGYQAVKQPDMDPDLYKVGKLPNAEVVNMGPTAITEYSIYNGSSLSDGVTPINLQIALDFVAKDTPAAAADNAYGQYTTDFYISIDGAENGSFVANGCYLAGNYGTFGWIMIPLDGMEIKNGEVYPVISSVGFDFSYEDICTSVKDFKCGIYFSPEVLAQNPNLTVSLNLGLSETVDQAKSAEFTSAIEEPFTYDVEDMTKAVAIAGPDYYTTVADAVEAALQTGDFVKLVADANLDRGIEISSDLVINLNGKTLSADDKALTITDSIVTITNGTLSAFSSDNVALTGNSVLTVTEGDFANSFREKSDYYVSQNADGATHSIMLKTAFCLHIAVVDGEPRIGFFKDTASGAPTYTMKGTAELGAAAVWQDVNFDVADDASGASTLPLYWAKPTEGTSYRFFKLSATERSSAE